jgi:excisionase family DNA binding protein
MSLKESLVKPSVVARRLDMSRSSVYRLFWEGMLQGVKFGKTIRIYESSVEQLIAEGEKLQEKRAI